MHVIQGERAVPLATASNTGAAPTIAQRVGTQLVPVAAAEFGRELESPEAAYTLPIKFRALAGTSTQTAVPVEFQPIVVVVSSLRFRQGSRQFGAELAVGLRNAAQPADRSPLVEPVKLLIRADADTITPPEVEIKRLGDPLRVLIAVSNPSAPFKISARTLLDDGDEIELPIHRPSLSIEPARTAIEGWGLGKTLVQVQADGLDDPGSFSVGLSTSQGDISPTPLTLQPDGRATAELRSDGTGVATIRATGVPLQEAQTVIRFVAPWRFLIAAVIGALVGWLLRTRARSKSARSVLIAVASAAVALVAYMLGIRWLQWAPQAQVGEALAFFIAAAGAFTGVAGLLRAKT